LPVSLSSPPVVGQRFESSQAHFDPADPSSFSAAVPNWSTGDTIHFGKRTLRVVELRDDDAHEPPILVVEDAS
jgi:hypothetical protein